MRKTLSFVKLDFITIKPYLTLKNLLIYGAVACIYGFSTGNAGALVGMLMALGSIYTSYPFAVGDKNGIDMLYATLAIKRNHVVVGRYLYALCMNILTGAIAVAIAFLNSLTGNMEFNITEILLTFSILFLFFSFIEAIQLPMYFKLGYSKAKLVTYLPYISLPFLFLLFSTLFDKTIIENSFVGLLTWLTANSVFTIFIALVVWAVILLISCRISSLFYKKRDF